MTELQKDVWNRIRDDFPHIKELSRNASFNTYIVAIESFLAYEDGFEFCESDFKKLLISEENDGESDIDVEHDLEFDEDEVEEVNK